MHEFQAWQGWAHHGSCPIHCSVKRWRYESGNNPRTWSYLLKRFFPLLERRFQAPPHCHYVTCFLSKGWLQWKACVLTKVFSSNDDEPPQRRWKDKAAWREQKAISKYIESEAPFFSLTAHKRLLQNTRIGSFSCNDPHPSQTIRAYPNTSRDSMWFRL